MFRLKNANSGLVADVPTFSYCAKSRWKLRASMAQPDVKSFG